MALNSVVLPAPLAPSTARRSPAATDNDMSSIARSAPNSRVTPSSTRASPEASGLAAGCSAVTDAMLSPPGLPGPASASGVKHSRAVRHVAAADAHLGEVGLRQSERLGHVVHHLGHLVVEAAVGRLGHFGNIGVADGVPVLIELDVSGRTVELELGKGGLELGLLVAEVAVDGAEAAQGRLGVDVVEVGEQRWGRVGVGEARL